MATGRLRICYEKEVYNLAPVKDLVGKRFGKLLVLSRAENYFSPKGYSQIKWFCHCDCGTEVTVLGNGLKRSDTTSCGCYRKENLSKMAFIDLKGKVFGRLTVVKRVKNIIKNNGISNVQWLCRCLCENELKVISSYLMTGHTTSCGCYQKEMLKNRNDKKTEELLGEMLYKKFGKLLVIKRAEDLLSKSGKNQTMLICECDCGNIAEIRLSSIKNGSTTSCGCLIESKVASGLKEYCNKKYKSETEYKEVKNLETNHWLKYDIFIEKLKIYIEIHGKQHYEFILFWHKTEEVFQYNKKLDKIKKKHAQKNGIYIEVDLRKIKTIEQAIEYVENKIKTQEKR